MKKKLAIFTAAVGFFTLCNIILYSRKLRVDETSRSWHWTSLLLQNPNCTMAYGGDPSGGCGASQDKGGGGVAKHHLLSLNNVMAENPAQAAHPPTTTSAKTSSQSSKTWYFLLDNRTYYVDVSATGVAMVGQNGAPPPRAITFSLSLFELYNITVTNPNVGPVSTTTATIRATVVPPQPPPPPGGATKLSSPTTYQVTKVPAAKVSTGPPAITLTALNKHNFDYLINVPDFCSGTSALTLVVLVTTAVNHFAERKAIRETWGSLIKGSAELRLAFVMGRPASPAVQYAVIRESVEYADVIQEDFMDTYKNLTLKTVMLMKWTSTFCSRANFIMKSDDDMYINVANLLRYINNLKLRKGQLFGRLVKGARPLRSKSSKYYVPLTEYKENVYPDYLSGTAYVMSTDVAARLYSVSQTIPIFFFEDVFITGICAKKAGITRRNHPGFVYYKRPVNGCAYAKVISGHNNTANDIKKIWRDFQNKKLKC